jgi:hypothetical protein
MHASVFTIEIAPDRFEESIARVTSRALQPVQQAPGFTGAYWFGDRTKGLAVAVAFLNTADALPASRDQSEGLRTAVSSAPAARVMYEVVAQTGPRVSRTAQFCRSLLWQEDPQRLTQAIERITKGVMPGVQQNVGFQGGFWLVERQTGRCLGCTLWDTAANLHTSGAVGRQMREEPIRRGDMHILSLQEYEVLARIETP